MIRKAMMAALMALTALALTAGSAAASVPYEDTDASNWEIVEAHDPDNNYCKHEEDPTSTVTCAFDSGTANDWTWFYASDDGSTGSLDFCQGGIAGTIGFLGDVEITSASASLCGWSAANLPWDGQACYHEPTGEFWLQQQLDYVPFAGATGSGTSYALIETEPHPTLAGQEAMSKIRFDVSANSDGSLSTGTFSSAGTYQSASGPGTAIHQAIFPVDTGHILQYVRSDPGSCPWPELS